MFGKEAADKYLCGAFGTLSESVVATIKTAGLAPEQVRRVIEFTNTEAFLKEFKKEGSKHKVIEFDGGPANYSDVLKDLNDGGGGTVFDTGSGDYNMPPPDSAKTAAANLTRLGYEDEKLASAFEVPESSLPYAEPFQESMDLKDKLAGAYNEVSYDISVLEVEYLGAIDDLFCQVKQAALAGTSLGQVVQAWSTVPVDESFVKAAFEQISPKLLENEVFPGKEAIGDSLMKTAHAGIVNPGHPLVGSYQVFCGTLTKLADRRQVQGELEEALDQISTFLKKAGVARSILDVAREIASKANKVSGPVGNTVGGATGTAVKYSPHVLAAAVAHKGYTEARDSPTRHRAMSLIPGTRQHQIRQHYKQQGRG
jgi:hypothetical protein